MKYEYTCGHVLEEKKAYKGRQCYVCPICYPKKRRIRYRVILCATCGAEVAVKPRGSYNPYCVDCLPADQRKTKKQSKAVGRSLPERRTDCYRYNDCIMPTGRLMRRSKACLGCTEYGKGEPLDIMDFILAGDSLQETSLRVAGPARHQV